MAYPTPPATAIPDIAADTNYDAAGEDWHATPTKVTPSAAVLAQGFVPGDLRIPMYDNFMFSWLRAWIVYVVAYCAELADRLEYASPPTRTLMIPASAFANRTGTWTSSSFGEILTATTNSAEASLDLAPYLPTGAVVTRVKALVDPGTANTMTLAMSSRTYDFTTPAAASHILVFSYATPSPGGAIQNIDPGAFTETIDKATKIYTLNMAAGAGAAANNDLFYAVLITFTDPGASSR
jgi:hypothetical protein